MGTLLLRHPSPRCIPPESVAPVALPWISMPVDRRSFLLSGVAAPFVQTRKRSTAHPNVVLFMTDDHGAWATGAYGARGILTPHIDRLANSGARFTRAFAATPVCSPSRMTWMTGCLPATHRVEDWLLPEDSFGPKSRDWLDGLLTWPEVLKAHGYTMAMCGKWHMGRDDRAQRGFTEWATVPGRSGPYHNPTFGHNGRPQPIQGFKEDALGDFALDFLAQQKNGHNFALLMPFYAPHTPFDFQPGRYRDPYRDSTFPDFPDTPVHPAQNPQLQKMHGNRDAKLGYSSLVTAADANIGRVLQRLQELGLRDNTPRRTRNCKRCTATATRNSATRRWSPPPTPTSAASSNVSRNSACATTPWSSFPPTRAGAPATMASGAKATAPSLTTCTRSRFAFP